MNIIWHSAMIYLVCVWYARNAEKSGCLICGQPNCQPLPSPQALVKPNASHSHPVTPLLVATQTSQVERAAAHAAPPAVVDRTLLPSRAAESTQGGAFIPDK